MIDRQGTRIVIECDCCDETVASIGGEEWAPFWARAREEGWRAKKIGSEFVHGCPRHAREI